MLTDLSTVSNGAFFSSMKVKKNWITDILVDLIVTGVIICAVILEYQWLFFVVLGYTLLLLLIKFFVVISNQFQAITKKGKSNAPAWIYHLLYTINVITLLIFGWYFTAAAWIIIWSFSIYSSKN